MCKYTLIGVCVLLNTLVIDAQYKFWGVTSKGGEFNSGVVFSANDDMSGYQVIFSADSVNDAESPSAYTQMVQDGAGNLYGVTELGGSNGQGLLFKYNPVTGKYTKIVDFDGANGKNPVGGLLVASNGKIYGTTQNSNVDALGGDGGAIFEYDPASASFSALFKFDGSDGKKPRGTLCDGGDGFLYGTTYEGGSANQGVVFKFEIATNTVAVLHHFTDAATQGAKPYAGLVKAGNLLIGSTSEGLLGYGGIFEYNLSSSAYNSKVTFNLSNGAYRYEYTDNSIPF